MSRTPIYFRRGNKVDLPVLNAGEPGFAVDTKELFIGHSSGNQRIPIVPPLLATWIAPTLLNSWVNFDANSTAGYYKDDLGIVRLKGAVKSGVITGGTTIFVLPAGYRPVAQKYFLVYSSGANGSIDVRTDGTVAVDTISSNAAVSFDNIQFRAEQ